jgi:hypothetical protein
MNPDQTDVTYNSDEHLCLYVELKSLQLILRRFAILDNQFLEVCPCWCCAQLCPSTAFSSLAPHVISGIWLVSLAVQKLYQPRGDTTSHSFFQQNIKQQDWPPTLQKNPSKTELRLTISSIVSARKQSTSRSTNEMVKKTPPPTARRPSTLL